ncbi:MAG: hypothetical protein MR364_05520 [Oscillospiraceae bacterium]|nr:hypothetical protein [Oscillospiraceae bacterium]
MVESIAISTERRKKIAAAAIFCVYAVITLIGATHHELWFDEAQAWGIARDATLETLPEILRHEGHPALWYLILMPFAKAGAYCEIINIISWFFSVVSAGLFMWKAPFGLVFKTAMLFSSGFLYLNSVNARVYCLIPLLLFFIAIVYPKRKKYAPVYGLLVGLLANTHVMMCGLVGILGIFMLIELFQSIKQYGVKKSWGRIAGIAIAGVLVLAMILPLVGALNTCSDMKDREYSVNVIFQNIINIFRDTGSYLMIDKWNNVFGELFSNIIGVIIILYFVFLFSYRKAFITSLVFLAFYTFISGVLWFIIPSRAIIFVYILTVIFWIAKQNEEPKTFVISYNGSGNTLLSKLTLFVIKAFANPSRTISVLLCVVLFSSSPTGLFWLFYDYGHDYTTTERTAEYIMNELPENSVIVTTGQDGIQFGVYTYGSGIRYYSLNIQDYITYNPHIYNNKIIDFSKIQQDFSKEENIYLIHFVPTKTEYSFLNTKEPIYSYETFSTLIIHAGYVEIYDVEMDDIIKISADLQSAYEE